MALEEVAGLQVPPQEVLGEPVAFLAVVVGVEAPGLLPQQLGVSAVGDCLSFSQWTLHSVGGMTPRGG